MQSGNTWHPLRESRGPPQPPPPPPSPLPPLPPLPLWLMLSQNRIRAFCCGCDSKFYTFLFYFILFYLVLFDFIFSLDTSIAVMRKTLQQHSQFELASSLVLGWSLGGYDATCVVAKWFSTKASVCSMEIWNCGIRGLGIEYSKFKNLICDTFKLDVQWNGKYPTLLQSKME